MALSSSLGRYAELRFISNVELGYYVESMKVNTMKQKLSMNIFASFFVCIMIVALMAVSVSAYVNPAPLNLGESGNFAVLSKVGISDTTPTATVITGDIGVSPLPATAITGIDCTEVVGLIHVVSAGGATLACQTVDPAYLTPTILEMEAAYTDANSRAYDVTLGGDIGGLTLTPGVYFSASSVGISTDVTLDCTSTGPTGVFIFQIGGNLDLPAATHVNLIGCQSGNIFWAVAGTTTIGGGVGTESRFEGTVLGGPATSEISAVTGSTVNGRLLGQKGIALDQNTITKPVLIIDSTPPVITLLGNSSVNVTHHAVYTDAGATALDDTDGNITASIVTVNPVNTTILGNYTITYDVSDAAGNPAIRVTRRVTVVPAASALTTITLIPASANLAVPATLQLNATGFDQYNVSIAVSFNYSSSNTSIATVSATGIVTAVAAGNATITANSGAVNATSAITVQPAPPILSTIGQRSVTRGMWLNFTIHATSPNGFNLTFAIAGKPVTANFTDNHDGSALFSWMPNASDVGVQTVNFSVTDGMKSDSESVIITVNLFQPPTTIATNPGSSWTNVNFNVTLNATGFNTTPIRYINYTLNGVPGQINESLGNVLINASGNNTLVFYAVDTSGNIEMPNTVYALLDKMAPNITSFTLSATSVYTNDALTGTCTATDNLDLAPVTVITGIDASSTGTKTATCTATDAAGNTVQRSLDYTVNQQSSGGGGGGGGSFCTPNWTCDSWNTCGSSEIQTRTCTDTKDCNTNYRKPVTSQGCVYIAPVTVPPKQNPPIVTPPVITPIPVTPTAPAVQPAVGSSVTGGVIGVARGIGWWWLLIVVGLLTLLGGIYLLMRERPAKSKAHVKND